MIRPARVYAGAREVLRRLKDHGLRLACVTNKELRHAQPDPEVYALALRRLGIEPLATLAIEDSPGGVAAARGA